LDSDAAVLGVLCRGCALDHEPSACPHREQEKPPHPACPGLCLGATAGRCGLNVDNLCWAAIEARAKLERAT
jgi:hypothetical protein